jgi:Tfp pilus assembly protein PilN
MRGILAFLLLLSITTFGCSGTSEQQKELAQLTQQVAFLEKTIEASKREIQDLPRLTEELQALERELVILQQELEDLKAGK